MAEKLSPRVQSKCLKLPCRSSNTGLRLCPNERYQHAWCWYDKNTANRSVNKSSSKTGSLYNNIPFKFHINRMTKDFFVRSMKTIGMGAGKMGMKLPGKMAFGIVNYIGMVNETYTFKMFRGKTWKFKVEWSLLIERLLTTLYQY